MKINNHNRNIKLLVITPYFYPKIGGMENYAFNISKGLKEKFHWDVVVITSNHEEHKYREDHVEGIKVYRLAPLIKISNTPINPLWYFQIKSIFSKEKPDIIIGHTPVPFISDMAVRVRKNVPFVLTYQNDLTKDNVIFNYICKLYYLLIGNNTLKYSDTIITTSRYYAVKSPYLSEYIENIKIVPPGVEITKYNPKVDKLYLKKIYGERPIILFVGQLDKTHIHKGIYFLIDSVLLVKKEFNNILLLLVGKGDNIDTYRKYVQKKSLENNIIFTEFLSSELLPKYYSGSNITVLPTYNNLEGFGMVLIEAGACGRPVIGTKVGGIPFVISNKKTGLIVPPKDSNALSEAIISLLKDTKLANTMGSNGYNKVKNNFTWDKQINKTKNILLNLLDNH